jgi:hypothetical protein
MREDESDAVRIDAELDAQQAQQAQLQITPRATATPGTTFTPGAIFTPGALAATVTPGDRADEGDLSDSNEPQEPQLWWENDPRFTSRFKPSS